MAQIPVKMKKTRYLVLALALLFGAKASAQGWEYSIDYTDDSCSMHDIKSLPNGNIAVTTHSFFPSSSLGSRQPGLLLFSPDGEELTRNSFYKPAFWGYQPHVLTDDDGNTYMLAAYNPDHDSTCANYFMNFDNPPDYSILGLYKLDERLSVVESHELQIPVDTSDTNEQAAFGLFNDYCGNIYVVSAIIDNGSVVGGYIKKPSFDYHHPHGNDSIFFFRIGLDGTLLQHVGYEMDPRNEPGGGGLNWAWGIHGHNIVKAGNIYYCFLNRYPISGYEKQTGTDKTSYPSYAYCLDDKLNIVDVKHYYLRNGLGDTPFQYAAYVGSRHNTVYLSCVFLPPDSYGCMACALYEYNLDTNQMFLHTLRYTERNEGYQSDDRIGEIKSVDIASDNSVFFAYALNEGMYGLTIERLSPEFDTLSTWYYGFDSAGMNVIKSIEVTDTDDILMTFHSCNYYYQLLSSTLIKIPAEAFWGIEEAHASGLKVALAYPNPGGNILNVCTSLSNARVEVYDTMGQQVHEQEIKERETTINAETWPSGLYVWKVYSNGKETETGKWVKE